MKYLYAQTIIIVLMAMIILFIYNVVKYFKLNRTKYWKQKNIDTFDVNNSNNSNGLKISWAKTNCNYYQDDTILEKVFSDYGISHIKNQNDANIILPCTYDDIDKEISKFVIKPDNKYFIIYNADQIVGKDLLWDNIVKYYGLQNAIKYMPNSYILYNKDDMERFNNEYDLNKIYIMKKNIQRQEGLKITKEKNEIINGYNLHKYVIVQELLQNPYIISDNINGIQNDRKINMRFYILVLRVNDNINVYVHKNGFMYYTKVSFVKNSLEMGPNITTGYIDREVYEKNPLTHDDFRLFLKNKNIDDTLVFKGIYDMFTNVFMALKNKLLETNLLKNNTTFQIFGADVAISDTFQPSLMEINKGPDLSGKDKRDSDVKYKVILDTLNIVNVINNNNNDFINVLAI